MIYTDRKYNLQQRAIREEKIARMEQERDELADRMFDDPNLCTPINNNRLNWLSSQIEIMKVNDKH